MPLKPNQRPGLFDLEQPPTELFFRPILCKPTKVGREPAYLKRARENKERALSQARKIVLKDGTMFEEKPVRSLDVDSKYFQGIKLSLGRIGEDFKRKILNSKGGVLHMSVYAQENATVLRRVYDVVNLLQLAGVVEKIGPDLVQITPEYKYLWNLQKENQKALLEQEHSKEKVRRAHVIHLPLQRNEEAINEVRQAFVDEFLENDPVFAMKTKERLNDDVLMDANSDIDFESEPEDLQDDDKEDDDEEPMPDLTSVDTSTKEYQLWESFLQKEGLSIDGKPLQ